MQESRKIEIFDTTLRDGQQCPGAAISFEQNLEYARLAHKAGIDILEAGFPAASKLDHDIVHTIATELAGYADSPTIAALCQQRREQVEKTIEALRPAATGGKARLHMYLPVAPELMEASLGERSKDKAALVRETHELCMLASKAGMQVEFSPEGYSRVGENFDFTTDLIRAAIEGGATVINCPDTIGGGCWLEGARYFVNLMNQHARIIAKEYPLREVTWSAHCHNDFGLALHNSLQAVFTGPCRQIEGCFNGIGERAGNVSLEQAILAIHHFGAAADPERPFHTTVKLEHIQSLSNFVATHMLPRQPHWPITGENAAKHSSGGHTNAILHNPLAYQPFDPREVGKEITFVFGPLSGGNHVKSIIEGAGYRCTDSEKSTIAQYIKNFYETRRKGVTDYEVLAAYFEYRKPIAIENFDYGKRSNQSEIFLRGRFFDFAGELHESYEGRDSALATLKKAIDSRFPGLQIVSYHSESASSGISATSISTIVVAAQSGKTFTGRGEDSDIEISAMRALIDGVNHAYIDAQYRLEQHP